MKLSTEALIKTVIQTSCFFLSCHLSPTRLFPDSSKNQPLAPDPYTSILFSTFQSFVFDDSFSLQDGRSLPYHQFLSRLLNHFYYSLTVNSDNRVARVDGLSMRDEDLCLPHASRHSLSLPYSSGLKVCSHQASLICLKAAALTASPSPQSKAAVSFPHKAVEDWFLYVSCATHSALQIQ